MVFKKFCTVFIYQLYLCFSNDNFFSVHIKAYYYGKKKKKLGRPPVGFSNVEDGQKKVGKRKKKNGFLNSHAGEDDKVS